MLKVLGALFTLAALLLSLAAGSTATLNTSSDDTSTPVSSFIEEEEVEKTEPVPSPAPHVVQDWNASDENAKLAGRVIAPLHRPPEA